MFLRSLFIGLLLLMVFATMGLILYDVVERGGAIPAAPFPTSTPFTPPTAQPLSIPPTPTPPTPTPDIPPTPEPTARPNIYILQPGQTLADVAELYELTAEQLAEYNNLSNPDVILSAGSELAIPPPSSP